MDWFTNIKTIYGWGRNYYTNANVARFVELNRITEEQYKQITGLTYPLQNSQSVWMWAGQGADKHPEVFLFCLEGGDQNGGIHVWMNFESLQIARTYLFGEVKYLDLLLILSILDVITGIIKAWKMKQLRSRSAWFGYVRKMLSFMVVIVANIIDTITNLNGVLTFGTVLFYIANEGLSITENLAQIGVKIPAVITDRLHVIESDNDQTKEKDDQAAG